MVLIFILLISFTFLCLFRPSWVRVLGTQYKIGAVVHVGFDNYLPIFGVIKSIFVLSSSVERVYFGTDILHTEQFCEEYRTYIVKSVVHPEFQLYPQKSLHYFLPLHFINVDGETHVLPKYSISNYL